MTRDTETVLSAMGDRRTYTTVDLARLTGFSAEFCRGACYQLRLARWVSRGSVVPDGHGARRWTITKAGVAKLEALAKQREHA